MAKKLLNSVESCVLDGLEGLAFMTPHVRLVEGQQIVVRADLDDMKEAGKPALLCGGGAGHEPAHAGFVGKGMLSAAVSGAVFASPPPSAIEEALLQVGRDSAGGVLVIVKNYTGDRINFGIAAERARLAGIEVATVVVNEDCALESANKMAGRRGLAGTVLVYKIVGAMAEEGRPLAELADVAQRLVANMGTIGIALTPCVLPGSSGPAFTIPSDAFELGLGIHGEAGARRERLASARDVARLMLQHLASSDTGCGLALRAGDRLVLLVNNLGATSQMEMMTMVREVGEELEKAHNVRLVRVLVGTVMTSLNMEGVSLTLLRVEDEAWLRWLDAASEAVAWRQVTSVKNPQHAKKLPCLMEKKASQADEKKQHKLSTSDQAQLISCVSAICRALMASQDHLDQLDRESGDADCGSTHSRAASAILTELNRLVQGSLAEFFSELSAVVETKMGGTSGGLYSLFFSAVAAAVPSPRASLSVKDLLPAFSRGVAAIQSAGGAAPGDRTLLDAMVPFEAYLSDTVRCGQQLNLKTLTDTVTAGAEATAQMRPQAGRASYVTWETRTVDPGAAAFAIMVEAAVSALSD